MHTLKATVRACIGLILRLAPAGSAEYIYVHILSPWPLRSLTNYALRAILPHSVRIPEGVVHLNPDDPVVSGGLALGVYEPFETELFRAKLKPGMTVLDVGANLGYHTVIAASRVGAAGRVIAFEPEPNNFELLSRNVRENNFSNVRLCNIAVADKQGVLTLHISDSNKGKHSLVNTSAQSSEYTRSIEVQTRTIDDVMSEQNVTRVDIIKMDIEGAEPLALIGMKKTLTIPGLTLFVEFSPTALLACKMDPVALLTTLREGGYSIGEIRESERRVVDVEDFAAFSASIPVSRHTNLLCEKR